MPPAGVDPSKMQNMTPAEREKMIEEMNAQVLTGSYHQSRTLAGPNEGDVKPHALGPPEPSLLPGKGGE